MKGVAPARAMGAVDMGTLGVLAGERKEVFGVVKRGGVEL